MRSFIFAAALLGSSAALAQASATTTTADGQQVQGATTQVIAVGDHYTVHRVMPDGTVMVQTLTGEQAKLAMKGEYTPPLAAGAMTMGAGTATPTQN
jgi:hypothetical protein